MYYKSDVIITSIQWQTTSPTYFLSTTIPNSQPTSPDFPTLSQLLGQARASLPQWVLVIKRGSTVGLFDHRLWRKLVSNARQGLLSQVILVLANCTSQDTVNLRSMSFFLTTPIRSGGVLTPWWSEDSAFTLPDKIRRTQSCPV
jgi:hypothetical protein